jgi:hypothetical protein
MTQFRPFESLCTRPETGHSFIAPRRVDRDESLVKMAALGIVAS